MNAYLARFILERAGATVEVAGDGRAGLERALAEPPDVVVLDLKLPLVDGFEVTEALRADARTRALPIVVTSAHAMAEEQARVLALGATAFIAKPIDPADFVRRIAACLPPLFNSE